MSPSFQLPDSPFDDFPLGPHEHKVLTLLLIIKERHIPVRLILVACLSGGYVEIGTGAASTRGLQCQAAGNRLPLVFSK